jgi:hypothetical protein
VRIAANEFIGEGIPNDGSKWNENVIGMPRCLLLSQPLVFFNELGNMVVLNGDMAEQPIL